jgi:hypothetical protein
LVTQCVDFVWRRAEKSGSDAGRCYDVFVVGGGVERGVGQTGCGLHSTTHTLMGYFMSVHHCNGSVVVENTLHRAPPILPPDDGTSSKIIRHKCIDCDISLDYYRKRN